MQEAKLYYHLKWARQQEGPHPAFTSPSQTQFDKHNVKENRSVSIEQKHKSFFKVKNTACGVNSIQDYNRISK